MIINGSKEVANFFAEKVKPANAGKINNEDVNAQKTGGGKSFEELLIATVKANKTLAGEMKIRQYALNKPELTVSKHAKQRAEQRNIDMDGAILEQINGAVIKAAGKNIRNVLVLSEEAAFIVSVDNNVVVTAMNNEDMRENVITNIDGTVII
jgi:flagellar operon protein